ncbi:MAG: T9SS type A sorting domain-containing protein [Prolixibacteraceae bacterium]|jgi:hypothetical protein|nr:T9SS type A sorting domain-containing protein [Prolixibacteraceae bacterium]
MKKNLLLFLSLVLTSTFLFAQETVKIAYVTSFSNLTAVGASDPIVAMLEADENIDLTVIEHDADDTGGPLDLSVYDVVVAQEAFGSSSTIYQRGQTLGMGTMPVPFILNKVYTMRDGRGFQDGAAGSGGEEEGTLSVTVSEDNQSNALFNGIEFTEGVAQLFTTGGDDNGGDSRTKGMQFATDVVISAENTLLASGVNDPENATVCINDIPSGATIGSETLQARMITMAMNYGAMSKPGDMTSAGLTLWRNAVYSLAGLSVPTEPVEVGGGIEDKTIILLTPDDRDDEQYTWLMSQDANVEKFYPSTTTLSAAPQEEVDKLNAADLIIIGRSPSSGDFGEQVDKDAWHAITTPIILNAQYVARSSRINWFNSTSADHFDEEPAMAVADVLMADDPVFTYATPTDGKLDWSAAPNDMLLEVAQTNGTILATFDYQENAPLFVRFEAGVAFYEDTEESPVAERVYFGFGNDNAGGVNFFPLTDVARNVYLAEIQRILGLPITEAVAALSSDASLTNIEVSVGELEPAFTPLFTTFSVELLLGTTSVDITTTTTDDGATVEGDGTVEIPEDGTSVVITVTAEDGTNTQTYTLNFSFETSVDDFANAWKVYPNPVNNTLNISGVDVKLAEVYNLSGSRMNVSARSMNQLDVSNLQQGAYIIKIQSINNETAVLKFNKR